MEVDDLVEPPLAVALAMPAASSGDAPPSVPLAALGDEVLDAAWESLQAKRREWALDERPDVEGFQVKLMGGAWARANLGRDYDAFRGVAKQGEASAWCRKYNLTMSAHFAIDKYGEEHACRLATAWVDRMSFYFALASGAGDATAQRSWLHT